VKAAVYDAFGQPPTIQTVPDPTPDANGVVIRVMASGVCRSDYHGWGGHDPTIQLPHVPGHELAGIIEAVGPNVRNWRIGDRVTVPFVGGCGACAECHSGNQQVCDDQFQPGFTHWGSFAQYVGVGQADLNLVALPETMEFATAASLGCRFVTAWRGVVDQGRIQPGQWLAVHGCGGVGLSAIMIAKAMGALIVAVDVTDESLALARDIGADHILKGGPRTPEAIHDLTMGGAHLSIDALGIPETCTNSVNSLRKRGRHVQLGWMLGDDSTPPIPMDRVMGNELEIIGSHGMQAHRYPDMMAMIEAGTLTPDRLIHETITLEQSIDALANFDAHRRVGITVITDFT
jgi:alcohol dehydrogenase